MSKDTQDALRMTLEACKEKFAYYAEVHAAKGGSEKAQVNRDMVAMIEAALASQSAGEQAGMPADSAIGLVDLASYWHSKYLEAIAQPAIPEGAVATVTISHFRGNPQMENRDFDYWGDLPPGTHSLYAAPLHPIAAQDTKKEV